MLIGGAGTYVLGFVDAVIEMIETQEISPVDEETSSFWLEYGGQMIYGTVAFFVLFIICLIGASTSSLGRNAAIERTQESEGHAETKIYGDTVHTTCRCICEGIILHLRDTVV